MDKLLENNLLAHNLNRIERLSRRALLRFLDRASNDKTNTRRLRSQARHAAIQMPGAQVDIDLARVEEST